MPKKDWHSTERSDGIWLAFLSGVVRGLAVDRKSQRQV
jgi:hypothetical protein